MSSTQYLKVSGRSFRTTLSLLCADPSAFSRGPFGQPEVLQRLLGGRHAEFIRDGLKPLELAVQGLELLALRVMLKAFESDDLHLAEGLIMVWYQYLEPIGSGSARAVAPVGKVLRHSAEPAHLAEFSETVRDKLGLSGEQAAAFAEAVGKLFLDVQEKTPSDSAERAYTNYLHRALETLATEPELDGLLDVQGQSAKTEYTAEPANDKAGAQESRAPLPGATAAMAAADTPRPDPLEPLAAYVKQQCAAAPAACGLQLPIARAIPRQVGVRVIRGLPAMLEVERPPAADGPLASLVLAGAPGSGRTTWLKRLAYGWAEVWQPGNRLAVYVHAAEFLPFARNRRSIAAFAARAVYPDIAAGRAERADLIQALEQSNEDGRVLWLVDDLDRLPPADQAEVLGQLALAPAVVAATTPWEADQIARAMPQAHLAEAMLKDLEPEEQAGMLAKFVGDDPERDHAQALSRWVLAEIPYLARLPLGIAAIAAQIKQRASSRVQIVRRALAEWLERAGQPALVPEGDWWGWPRTSRSLRMFVNLSVAEIFYRGNPGIHLHQSRFEQAIDRPGFCRWDDLAPTRLFEPANDAPEALRLANRDFLAYLAAQVEASAEIGTQPTPPVELAAFIRAVSDYRAALWELAGR